jgi:hypothetical protein
MSQVAYYAVKARKHLNQLPQRHKRVVRYRRTATRLETQVVVYYAAYDREFQASKYCGKI